MNITKICLLGLARFFATEKLFHNMRDRLEIEAGLGVGGERGGSQFRESFTHIHILMSMLFL